MRFVKFAAPLLLAGLCASGIAAHAQSNLSTGLDANTDLLTSGGQAVAYWTVPPQAGGVPVAPQTVFPNNADWYGGWVANGPNSDWIARNPNVTNNGAAPYTFSNTFDLTGYDVSSAAITGAWTLDDGGTLDLNGNNLGTLGSGDWTSLHTFSVPMGSAFFLPGLNTLNITITDSDQFLEAVRLEGTLTYRLASVPEPGSVALLVGMGFSGAGFLAQRRRNTK